MQLASNPSKRQSVIHNIDFDTFDRLMSSDAVSGVRSSYLRCSTITPTHQHFCTHKLLNQKIFHLEKTLQTHNITLSKKVVIRVLQPKLGITRTYK